MLLQQLSESHKRFLMRLTEIEFGSIAFRLMNSEVGDCLTLEQATYAIEQYRRFLFLHYSFPNQLLVPSQDIDLVWHCHILDTTKYREDCEFLFGRFIDHHPHFGRDSTEQQHLEAAYTQTQLLLEQCFKK